jgi:hypothetical protein
VERDDGAASVWGEAAEVGPGGEGGGARRVGGFQRCAFRVNLRLI